MRDNDAAIIVSLAPNVCKSPSVPVPYPIVDFCGHDQNYAGTVRSSGLIIKKEDSKFTRTYGDQPGVGLGVKSGTVGDVVEPVTNSPIVRVEGKHVIRHRDKCTLNKGNCPGEYIHVKSVKTHVPPDGNDEDDKRGGWQKFKEQLIEKSKTEQDAGRTATLRLGLPWLFWPERIFSLLPVRFASPERVRGQNIFRLRISDVALG